MINRFQKNQCLSHVFAEPFIKNKEAPGLIKAEKHIGYHKVIRTKN